MMYPPFLPRLLATAALLASVSSAQAITVAVGAQANSSTGGIGVPALLLDVGQHFCISVDPNDLWSAGALPRWSNADGLTGNLFATGSDESGEAMNTLIGQDFGLHTVGAFSAPYGALVGELGGVYFLIGTSYSGTAAVGGTLNLHYWDSNNYDNAGAVESAINVGVACVPDGGSSVVLLGTALGALFMFRRRSV